MTSTEKHHKHPPLPKPSLGEWGRNEVAILGAPCPSIKTLAEAISKSMQSRWKVCYIDADHAEERNGTNLGFNTIYSDKIQNRRLDFQSQPSMFTRRALLTEQDVVLVNGNHFTAKEQIVLLHSKKLESLQRKTDKLTNVIAVIESDTTIEACSFLTPYLRPQTEIYKQGEQDALIAWFNTRITAPPIHGLVLAGGKSLRMGKDKSVIAYHGIPQRDYLLQLIDALNIPVQLSCRADQVDQIHSAFPLLPDRIEGLGPYGAILSAMMSAPDAAWLVIATDLPFVAQETLQQLISNRNPSKVATAFLNPSTGFPEPLITLWEPKAYPVLLSFLAQGSICPRKALINSDVHLIHAENPQWLMNVNTPEEEAKATTFAKASAVKKAKEIQ